jgi:predicted RNA binding protein YcfA (HicA-like mRNA interferase family)
VSADRITQALRALLVERGGTAPAGELVAALEAAGFANSSIRGAASHLVDKHREGNTFTWSLKEPDETEAPTVDEAQSTSRADLAAAARELLIEFDDMTTDVELEVLVEMARNGELDPTPQRRATPRLPY